MPRLARTSILVVAALAACERAKAPVSPVFVPPTDSLNLDIPDRQWASDAPPEGWCGEASIQMAALHFGAWLPQSAINQAGHPKTPDLWETDVPVAMRALGLRFETFQGNGTAPFLAWIVESLRRGRPVILGVKLYPTSHPEWNVDHLVLAVGFKPEGLTLDTNWGDRQLTWPWELLEQTRRGYSLVGPAGKYFGYAVQGFEGDGPPVTTRVQVERPTELTLEVGVRGLSAGAGYALVEEDLAGATTRTQFVATGSTMAFRRTVPAGRSVRFSCSGPVQPVRTAP